MANVRTRPVDDDRHFITCHSRESGNPERASADPTLDSRFRGNDKGGGWPLTAPKRSLAFTVSCTGACRRADIRRSSTAPFRIRPCRREGRKERKRVGLGKSVSGLLDLGGCRIHKKQNDNK